MHVYTSSAQAVYLFVYYLFFSFQLPDLMHSESLQLEPIITFILQNIGLLTGFIIMLLIALFEEDLMALDF